MAEPEPTERVTVRAVPDSGSDDATLEEGMAGALDEEVAEELAEEIGAAEGAEDAPPQEEPSHPHVASPAPVCSVAMCPICLAVTAVQPLKPEVIEHLLVAGREFFLAFRALLDQRGDDMTGHPDEGDGGLEKIDIG
jgi:hypothetical protein